MQKKAIVIEDNDNVATLVEVVECGDSVVLVGNGPGESLTAEEDIPFGHKIAINEIKENEDIVKFGERIGVAKEFIKEGDHVHSHNLKSLRMSE